MSKLNDILDYIVAAQTSLLLEIDGQSLPCVKRILTKKEDAVDATYQTTISAMERPDHVKRIAFGSCWQVIYDIEIAVVTPNERDMVFSLADHANWKETTRAWLQKPRSIAIDSVKRVEIQDSPLLDHSKLGIGYNITWVAIAVTTYERRT